MEVNQERRIYETQDTMHPTHESSNGKSKDNSCAADLEIHEQRG